MQKKSSDINRDYSKFFCFFLVVFVLALYGNTILNDFVMVDDYKGFVSNPNLSDISTHISSLPSFIMSAIAAIFGIIPLPYRIYQISMHVIFTLLSYVTLKKLFEEKTAIIGSLVTAAHSVNTEAVDWISAQAYPLQAILSYVAIFIHLSFRQTKRPIFLYVNVIFYALMVIFFPNAWILSLPIIIGAIDYFFVSRKFQFGEMKIFWIGISCILLLFLIIRFPSLVSQRNRPESKSTRAVLANEQKLTPIIQGYPYSLYKMASLYLYPSPLTVYYDGNPLTAGTFVLMYAAFALYIALFFILFYKKSRFAGFLIILPLWIAPVFSPQKVTWFITERYLYAGTPFYGALVGMLIVSIWKFEKVKFIALALVVGYLILLASQTYSRNQDWANGESLALATIKTSPLSPRPYNDLGSYYLLTDNVPLAKKTYARTLRVFPSSVAMNNLGLIYLKVGLDKNVKTLDLPKDQLLKLAQSNYESGSPMIATFYLNEAHASDPSDKNIIKRYEEILKDLQ